ncbi:MAG: STAS domain-containing protein, partial [Chloroflexia bacterium]|nr:STAS domain-containing protein [Chloroflexia bacterium]
MANIRDRFFPSLTAIEKQWHLDMFRLLMIVQVSATVVFIGLAILDAYQVPGFLLPTVAVPLATILFSLVGYWLARRGYFYIGAVFLVLGLLACLGYLIGLYGTRGPIPFIVIWPVMVAATLLSPTMAFVVATLAALMLAGLSWIEFSQMLPLPALHPQWFAHWHQASDPIKALRYHADTVNVVVMYYAAAFLSWIASRSLRKAVEASQSQAAELERYRDELENRVAARTQDLAEANRSLQDSLETIREVGSPVLPLLEDVVLVPLIGTIDSERATQVMERVLSEVARERARAVIVDVTGVPVVDTMVAKALVQ